MIGRMLGYSLIVLAVVLVGAAVYLRSSSSTVPIVFTPTQVLAATWVTYKQRYVDAAYRTVDVSRDNITTSEGQSYTMLRAVWMGDKQTFDGAWTWTKEHLQHAQDALFAWKWGNRADGTEGILVADNGATSASDADINIALALIFAYARWQDRDYLREARAIVRDIWRLEVIEVNGVPHLAANDREKALPGVWFVVNPSYFNPAAYRLFAQIDRDHDWGRLAQSSYDLLRASTAVSLDTGTTSGLPPNWLRMHKVTGELRAAPGEDTYFGFDAMRVPFQIALDQAWFGTTESVETARELAFLGEEWRRRRALASVYTHDGYPADPVETPAMYGATIGYFMLAAPQEAPAVYEEKLLSLYDPGINTWRVPLSYYDDNWAWFGIALYNQALPNLAAEMPTRAFTAVAVVAPYQ